MDQDNSIDLINLPAETQQSAETWAATIGYPTGQIPGDCEHMPRSSGTESATPDCWVTDESDRVMIGKNIPIIGQCRTTMEIACQTDMEYDTVVFNWRVNNFPRMRTMAMNKGKIFFWFTEKVKY